MRTLKLFAVHDVAAEAFMAPHSFPTTAMAIRAFSQACEDSSTQFHQTPSDYTLFQIGEFSDETGEVTPCTPLAVAKALDFARSPGELKAVSDG